MNTYKKSIKPILFGTIISIFVCIIVTKAFWWIVVQLHKSNGLNPSVLENHPTINIIIIRFGLYVMPFLFAFGAGYVAHKLSENSGLLHSFIVGIIGSLAILGNVYYEGTNLVYPLIYIFYGVCWTPATVLGGLTNKLVKKHSIVVDT